MPYLLFCPYLYHIKITTSNIANMVLKATVLATLRNHKTAKNRLALELDKSSYTIEKWIRENDDSLTKAAALRIIREELGLTDAEILEDEKVPAVLK